MIVNFVEIIYFDHLAYKKYSLNGFPLKLILFLYKNKLYDFVFLKGYKILQF